MTEKWVLILEDDVKLCSNAVIAILNIMRNDTLNWVYLGEGTTGTLVRITFIPIVLKILQLYPEHRLNTLKRNWVQPLDRYIIMWINRRKWGTGVVASEQNLLWHPGKIHETSTFGHDYRSDFICGKLSGYRTMSNVPTMNVLN